MGRFQNSWAITKQSWAVLRSNPSLAIFPVLSGLATIAVSASFIVPFVMVALGSEAAKGSHQQFMLQPLHYVLGFLYYFLTYFVIIFFNSALVTCAHRNLLGQSATIGDGLSNATRHLGKIVGWSAIAATVGQIIRALQDRGGIVGSIVGSIVGIAWSLAIFFVVPLMVIENLGPIDALKNSADRLKRTWGEQLILNGGMGLASFLFVVAPAMMMVVGGIVLLASEMVITGIVLAAVGLLYLLAGMVVVSAMTVIYQTALYLYTSSGTITQWYDAGSIQSAFVPKASRRMR